MKKIFAVLMSVAVLFAFAACDNSSTTNPYFGKQVVSVTLQSTPDYLAGETINPAEIALRVVYDDGTIATVYGDEVSLYREIGFKTSPSSTAKNPAEFTAVYGTENPVLVDNAKEQTWTIKIPVYVASGLKIDTANAVTTVAEGDDVSTEGLVYTVQYKKGEATVERVIEAKDLDVLGISVKATVPTTAEADDKDVKVTVTASGAGWNSNNKITGVSDWTVDVIEDTADVVTNVTIVRDTDYDLFSTATEGAKKLNTIADIEYVVTVEFGDGTKKTYNSDEIEGLTMANFTNLKSVDNGDASMGVWFKEYNGLDYKLTNTDTNLVAYVAYKLKDGEMQVKTAPLSIGQYTTDYITIYNAVRSDDSATFAEGEDFNLTSDFKFTVKAYASGKDPKENEEAPRTGIDFAEESRKVAYGAYAADSVSHSFPVEFVWKGSKHNQTISITGTSVTVADPNAPASV